MKTKFTIALLPMSARPWHHGHTAILMATCRAFDKVIIGLLQNPDKTRGGGKVPQAVYDKMRDKVVVVRYQGMLRDLVKKMKPDAIVRGIRNFQDFEYEKTQQYWQEDLGIEVPFFYVISPRELAHVSSSAIRTVNKLVADSEKKEEKK